MSGAPEGYIDVASRIAAIKGDAQREYPNGSFQPWGEEPFRVVTIEGTTFVAYSAAFYRDPDDQRPGVGSAWEQVPGRTPFTRGSELQNAETSAWGRALVAALAADTKSGIASADEVQSARAASMPSAPPETDRKWMTDFDARVLTAHNEATLGELWKELAHVYNEGRCTDADKDILVSSWTARKQTLIGAGA